MAQFRAFLALNLSTETAVVVELRPILTLSLCGQIPTHGFGRPRLVHVVCAVPAIMDFAGLGAIFSPLVVKVKI